MLVWTSNMNLRLLWKVTSAHKWGKSFSPVWKFSGCQTPEDDFLVKNIFLKNDFRRTNPPFLVQTPDNYINYLPDSVPFFQNWWNRLYFRSWVQSKSECGWSKELDCWGYRYDVLLYWHRLIIAWYSRLTFLNTKFLLFIM